MNSRQVRIDEGLLRRISGEFLEMPGLRLTCRQAQRLWALDEKTCAQVLEHLVDAKFLYRPGHGMYARLTDGNSAAPRPRMSKAQMVDGVSPTKQAV